MLSPACHRFCRESHLPVTGAIIAKYRFRGVNPVGSALPFPDIRAAFKRLDTENFPLKKLRILQFNKKIRVSRRFGIDKAAFVVIRFGNHLSVMLAQRVDSFRRDGIGFKDRVVIRLILSE